MCGIFGYIGPKNAIQIALKGLKNLEYRGYDSAGAVFFDKNNKIILKKAVGRVAELEKNLFGYRNDYQISIFHTRWATHGKPSIKNAHPHFDCKSEIFLVHNGIIENYQELKNELKKQGHKFSSETDTEVVAHLIETEYKNKTSLEEAVSKALNKIIGTYGLAIISEKEPGKIVAAKNSSPLIIGVGKNEYFLASDASAIVNHTKKIIYLDDGDIAVLKKDGFKILTPRLKEKKFKINNLNLQTSEIQKSGFSHFMLKEIFEQPKAIKNTLAGRLDLKNGRVKIGGFEESAKQMPKIEKISIIACGSAYHAGLVGKYMFEDFAGIPCQIDVASEFRYRNQKFDKSTLHIIISQSGETADTLAALRKAKSEKSETFGIVNVVGSTISREVDFGLYNHAGPEIGVASTKAYTSQFAALAILALYFGRQENISKKEGIKLATELNNIPKHIEKILKQNNFIKKIARKYKDYSNFLYLGRKYNLATAYEGALKLKEISYIHAEGCGAGEMKHGPIALIDKNFPSVVVAPQDSVYEKVISNIEEIKAREGRIIAIATEGDKKIRQLADEVIYIPETLEMLNPILAVVPLQLLAYHIAVLRGCDVDKPRNLAKSVTVE